MHRTFHGTLFAGALCAILALTACDEHAAQHLAVPMVATGQISAAVDPSDAATAYFGERFAQVQAALAERRDETPAAPSF